MKAVMASLAALGTLGAAQAGVLFTFDFAGADPAGDASAPVVEHLTVNPFTRVNVNPYGQENVFSSSAWNQTMTLDPTEYVEFSLRPQAGAALQLEQLAFDISRSTAGPQYASVEYLANGTSWKIMRPFNVSTTGGNITMFLGTSAQLAADEVGTFRFYGLNASGTGNLRLDNVAVSGALSLTSVPEPRTGALLMAGGIMVYAVWRRQQRR